jgi:hypothetical protein
MTALSKRLHSRNAMERYLAKKQREKTLELYSETKQQKGSEIGFDQCGVPVGDRSAGRRGSPWWVD